LGDGNEKFVVRENGKLAVFAVTLDAIPAQGKPIRQGEVDGFIEVELYAIVSLKST
jgi:hypothetical protein